MTNISHQNLAYFLQIYLKVVLLCAKDYKFKAFGVSI